MDLNAFFDEHPMLRQLLDLLDEYGGMIFAAAFFLFMFYILYWALVVLPRRVRKIFSTLRGKDYVEMSNIDPDIKQGLSTCAPIYAHTPRKDSPIPEWNIRNACRLASVCPDNVRG